MGVTKGGGDQGAAGIDRISTGAGLLRIGADGTHTATGTLTLAGAVRLRGLGHGDAATLELRAGIAKDKALRNLALRTGVEDVDGLVKMLIQADRFGTSVGTALRVQSDQLRTRRRQIIEEKAGKIATKLLFPLIFCIFPTLLMVLLGPAGIQIARTLKTALGGAH